MGDFDKYRLSPRHDATDYAHMLKKLLPLGRIWGFNLANDDDVIYDSNSYSTELFDSYDSMDELTDKASADSDVETSTIGKIFRVIGAELARLEERVYDLFAEYVPGLSVELIDEWYEQTLKNTTDALLVQTDDDKRRMAHGKIYNESQLVNVSMLENYGLTLGFDITVDENPETSIPSILPFRLPQSLARRGVLSLIEITINSGTGNLELMKSLFNSVKPAHTMIRWIDER